ncbi:MAG: hypothetical protein ACRCV9_16465 [Burkholderiaceae bacterium]
MNEQLMSLREYARHKNVTLRAVQKARGELNEAGLYDGRIGAAIVMLPGAKHAQLDVAKADALWLLNTDAAKQSPMFMQPPSGKPEDLGEDASSLSADKQAYHKARAEREQISLKNEQLDLAERLGELVSVDEAIELGATTLRILRDALRNTGARISAQLAAMTEPHDCEQLVNSEVDAALNAVNVETLMKPADDEYEDALAVDGD